MSSYELFSSLAAASSLLVAAVALFSKQRSREAVPFGVSVALIGCWSAFPFLTTVLTDPAEQVFAARLVYTAAAFIPLTFWHMYFLVMGLHENRDRLVLRYMLVMSIPFALLAWNSSYIAGVYSSGAFRAVIPGPLYWLFVLHFLVMGWYGLIRMLSRYRTSNVSQRNKLKYLFLGYGTALCGGAEHFAAGYIRREIVPHDLFIIAFVFIVAYAILMHRLMDITVIIRKTLVYSLVMGILTATYLVIVALFARFFEGLTGYQTVYSSAVAAVLITLCFQPLRRRIQSFVDRKFFRQYVDREEKLYELSREVITHTTPEAMGGALMHVLNETLHPKGGALFLRSRDGSGFVRVSDIGTVVLPARMEEDNELAQYFKDHPKPFVQDMSEAIGRSESTRLKEEREDAA